MMESESCIITTKNRISINPSSSLHFEQKISLNGHCDGLPPQQPRRNNSQVNQNGVNEQKRWSTSYSKSSGANGDSTTKTSSQHQLQFNQYDLSSRDNKLPSYVGISCTISGYSSYSRYCSSIRGSVSRGSSPVMRNYEVIDGPNVVHHHHTHHHFHHPVHHHNNNHNHNLHLDSTSSQQQQQQRQSDQYNQQCQPFIDNWSKGSNYNGVTTIHNSRNNNNNKSVLYGQMMECNDDDDDHNNTNGSSEKSLVQRRIESLYGSNVAEVWRDSRSKVKKVNKKVEMINHRSPSCPPHVLRSKECKKSPAVFSHLNEKFLSQIDADPKIEPVNGLVNSLNDVLKVNGTKQTETNGTQLRENGYHVSETNGHSNIENHLQCQKHHEPGPVINGNGLNHKHSYIDNDHDDTCNGKDQVDKAEMIKLDNGIDVHVEDKENQVIVKKGETYLLKLEEIIDQIKVEIVKTEKLLEDESQLMSEEVTGNVRCSIGKANLLIAQKLNQFRELCYKNINGNVFDQFSTKNEDLDGFWEMVYIQIEEVLNGFEEIYKLRQNNWIIISTANESSSKANQPKTRSPRKVITSKASPNKQPANKNTARDEMRKQRLREAKLKTQSRLQDIKTDNDIVIFTPPSNGNAMLTYNGSNVDS